MAGTAAQRNVGRRVASHGTAGWATPRYARHGVARLASPRGARRGSTPHRTAGTASQRRATLRTAALRVSTQGSTRQASLRLVGNAPLRGASQASLRAARLGNAASRMASQASHRDTRHPRAPHGRRLYASQAHAPLGFARRATPRMATPRIAPPCMAGSASDRPARRRTAPPRAAGNATRRWAPPRMAWQATRRCAARCAATHGTAGFATQRNAAHGSAWRCLPSAYRLMYRARHGSEEDDDGGGSTVPRTHTAGVATQRAATPRYAARRSATRRTASQASHRCITPWQSACAGSSSRARPGRTTMFLTTIEVRDFQSLHHARLDLAEWTSLVGESDVGKSAVVRALHAALTNRRGDAFIRHEAKHCDVTLTLASGHVITWTKHRGRSGIYRLAQPDGSAEVYEKTGSEVPAAVAALIQVAVDVDGDTIVPGIQRQHDQPFLLADTPRRRAQILGEFDGTNITLRAEALVRTTQRQAQQAVTAAQQEAEQAAATIAELRPAVDAARAAVDAADELAGRHERAEQRVSAAALVRDNLNRIGRQALAHRIVAHRLRHVLEPAPDLMGRLDRWDRMVDQRDLLAATAARKAQAHATAAAMPDVAEARDALVAHLGRRVEIAALADDLRARQQQRSAAATVVDRLAHAPLDDIRSGLAEIADLAATTREAARAVSAFSDAHADAKVARIEESQARDALADVAGQPCPVCGQPLEAA